MSPPHSGQIKGRRSLITTESADLDVEIRIGGSLVRLDRHGAAKVTLDGVRGDNVELGVADRRDGA